LVGFLVGFVFGGAELVDAVGEFGSAGACMPAELVTVMCSDSPVVRGVGRAFRGGVPALLELVGSLHEGGLFTETSELGVERLDVTSLAGIGGEPERVGALVRDGEVARELVRVALGGGDVPS
jgi:hypothetical protein